MSRLDELERELFRLASSETPSPNLRQRMHERLAEAAESAARKDESSEREQEQPRRGAGPRRRTRRVVASFVGAAALAATAALLLTQAHDREPATTVEAEPLPPPALPPAPATPQRVEAPVVQPRPVASAKRVQAERPALRTKRSLAEQLEVLGQAR